MQEGIEAVTERMSQDWSAGLDELDEQGLVDATQLGYVGMSMGARFGLPLAGRLGKRLRCRVIGKFGLEQRPDMDPGLLGRELFSAAARSLAAPTLFHLQRDDEIFPTRGQLELSELLGAEPKHLLSYSGAHAETPPDAIVSWHAFIAGHLGQAGSAATAVL